MCSEELSVISFINESDVKKIYGQILIITQKHFDLIEWGFLIGPPSNL